MMLALALMALFATGLVGGRVDFDSLHATAQLEDEALRAGSGPVVRLRCWGVATDPTSSRSQPSKQFGSPLIRRSAIHTTAPVGLGSGTDFDCIRVVP